MKKIIIPVEIQDCKSLNEDQRRDLIIKIENDLKHLPVAKSMKEQIEIYGEKAKLMLQLQNILQTAKDKINE